ncbi:MAG TPA: DUF559 domain-containing protein [Trebonia sp.]|nr:DUF559 domain-containing protein [Trebonia sp.]
MHHSHSGLSEALGATEGVLTSATALCFMSEDQLRWKISSGRWQKPVRGVIVAQSGPLTANQMLHVTLLAAGPRAALAGLTAARLDGLTGFDDKGKVDDRPIYLLAPHGYRRRTAPLGLTVITHYSKRLGDEDVHPAKQPRRTRIARSIVDAASWMATDRGAMAVLAASVQQRLVRVADVRQAAEHMVRFHRRKLILETLGDIAGGAQALSELDFTRSVVRAFHLPEPTSQSARRDARGRRRWTDVSWDDYKLAVEIDGAQHTEDPLQRWDDMERDIDLGADGYRTLRFPAWLVRQNPQSVARTIGQALHQAGYRG